MDDNIFTCLREVIENAEKSGIKLRNINTIPILNFIETAKKETDRRQLFKNGRILAIYAIYRILEKVGIPDNAILKITLSTYSSSVVSGFIDNNKNDTNVVLNDTTADQIKKLFNNNISYILSNIEDICGKGSCNVLSNVVPRMIHERFKPSFNKFITNDSFNNDDVVKYLSTGFNDIQPDNYKDFNSLNKAITGDPSLLITTNFIKNINDKFDKIIDKNSRKLFELLNDIYLKYEYNNFKLSENIINGTEFYAGATTVEVVNTHTT